MTRCWLTLDDMRSHIIMICIERTGSNSGCTYAQMMCYIMPVA
jgi:hypothetical protein